MRVIDKKNQGFSLIELMVSLALGLLILGAAGTLFKKGMDISLTLSQRAEMQQNARAGINAMVRDASLADTDLPTNAIQLPLTAAPLQPRFGCGAASVTAPVTCYLNTTTSIFAGGFLYPVNPHQEDGALTNSKSPVSFTPDTLVLAYADPSMDLGQIKFSPNGDVTGGQIVVMNPPANIAGANGISYGDLVMLTVNGASAIGVVTAFDGVDDISFAQGDPLNINQPPKAQAGGIDATTNIGGNITSNLMNPNPPANPANPVIPGADGSPAEPSITAQRIFLVTYFVYQDPTGRRMLMRQVNAHLATPIAENVENLQVSYDTIDNTATPPAPVINQRNLGAASPNLIRKINIALTVRTSQKVGGYGDYQRLTLATSVSPRNMSKTAIF